MSKVLYRKWRPQRLDHVVGQKALTQTLRNAVALGRVAHAYLFCGPRGTGKTSTARILAKAVNCLSPQNGEPDNQCEICTSINEARALDLIEIDAASNRGIDDIRSLRDKVHFTPNQARHKVYIVDEVHMLTEQAFNALLKTLEEPPEHAIFVLATTEVHKVPLTIISRCQRFDFRRIPLEVMEARLAKLCEGEGIEAAPEALRLIARAGAGSLRDAENLLEQAIVSYGSTLSGEQARDLLEITSEERALELAAHVANRAVQDGLTVINQVAEDGHDLRQFHRGVTESLRGILLLKSGAEVALGYSEETKAEMRSLAEGASMDHLAHAMKTFARAELRRDSLSPLPLELALLESSRGSDVWRAVEEPGPTASTGRQVDSPSAVPGQAPGGPAKRNSPPPVAPAVAVPSQVRGGPPESNGPPPVASAVAVSSQAPGGPPESNGPPPVAPAVAVSSQAPGGPPESNGPPPVAPAVAVSSQAPGGPPESNGPPPVAPAVSETKEGANQTLPSEPSSRLESQWDEILKSLSRHKGKRFNLGALLRDCKQRDVANGVVVLKFSYRSHMERMEEELQDPGARKVLKETFEKALDGSYDIEVLVIDGRAMVLGRASRREATWCGPPRLWEPGSSARRRRK